ncbi:MAG: DUF1214 domain-containing protein [Deltaproteobacteria bacterium]|jgi:hypothetical protein|nr:DUF1214 domain-containing protein [Deltaproteobacteria bacterium]MBW2499607.1 DUF1214 domain-containing protein [Deltaproteobacteria bacterium]
MTIEDRYPGWEETLSRLQPVAKRLAEKLRDPEDEQARQELYKMMMSAVVGGYVGLVYNDPDYPEWVPMLSNALNFAAPVPDFVYTYAPIRGEGTYRVAGHRGTSLFAVLTVSETYFTRTDTPKPGLENYDLDELTIGDDGRFEVVLSAERPSGYEGDWWYLDPAATNLAVRHAMYDWLNEVDPRMSIERLDVPAIRPPTSAEELSARMQEVDRWVEYSIQHWLVHLAATREKGIVNRFEVHDYSGFTGSSWPQTYLEGLFEIEEDEALIIETEIPEQVRYWSFLVADDLFATIDWTNRQSSLNGHQARLDSDGRFRGVVAARDPGVPNWLDTGGCLSGALQGRWNQASSAPHPSITRVRLADLRDHLPADTPVMTPEERDRVLRERRMGAHMRRKW